MITDFPCLHQLLMFIISYSQAYICQPHSHQMEEQGRRGRKVQAKELHHAQVERHWQLGGSQAAA